MIRVLALGLLVLSGAAAEAEVVAIDYLLEGDQLITRDTETGLDWLDLTVTTAIDVHDFRAGTAGAGLQDEGWRIATMDEVCEILGKFSAAPSPCPGIDSVRTQESLQLAFDFFGESRAPIDTGSYVIVGTIGDLLFGEDNVGAADLSIDTSPSGIVRTYSAVVDYNAGGAITSGIFLVRSNTDRIDHYKVYSVDVPSHGGPGTDYYETAGMTDQFGFSDQYFLAYLNKFANPLLDLAPRGPTPLRSDHPDEHLSWWQFQYPEPFGPQAISVSNEVGPNQKLVIGDAEYLVVPTSRDAPYPSGIELNQHYKCYVVASGPEVGVTVELTDAFGTSSHTILAPRYFCTPVDFWVVPSPADNGFGIPPSGPPPLPYQDLLCYEITPGPGSNVVYGAPVLSYQLSATLDLAEMLCVRSSSQSSSAAGVPASSKLGLTAVVGLIGLMGLAIARRQPSLGIHSH